MEFLNNIFSPETALTIFTAYQSVLYILGGVVYTVLLMVGALFTGFCLGIIIASFQVYGSKYTKLMARAYIWVFRGIPILVLLFLVYYGIFSVLSNFLSQDYWSFNLFAFEFKFKIPKIALYLDKFLTPFMASIIVLGLASGAYQSQIFRGAMESLPLGQYKAAQSLGMTNFQTIKTIILPQALRLSIPAWSNEFSILLKDSALAYILGTLEIMARVDLLISSTYMNSAFILYAFAAVLYFILTWFGLKALNCLNNKTKIPGLLHDVKGPGYY